VEAAPGERPRRSLLGIVIASEEVRLRTPFPGVVDVLGCRVGEVVKKGAVLAHVDAPDLRGQVSAAGASLQEAEAHAEGAARALLGARERARRVNALRKYVSREERSNTRHEEEGRGADLAAARAAVSERSAHLRSLEQQLGDAVIRAPFDGVVGQRFVHPLDRVGADALILLLAKEGRPRVRFAGAPAVLAAFHVGDRVEVDVEGVPGVFAARVDAINPEIDPGSRLLFAEATFEGEATGKRLRPGLVARVEIGPAATDSVAKGDPP
jgi:RND family efflux transporter MFP subunit